MIRLTDFKEFKAAVINHARLKHIWGNRQKVGDDSEQKQIYEY